jgi:hypothetical protein
MTKAESNNDKKSLSKDISNFLSHGQKTMISGGIAGCIAKTITAPLSRLTILLQVGPLLHVTEAGSSASSKYKFSGSLFCATKHVLKEEGILAFWRGNLTSVIHRFPYSAINFTVYDELQGILRHLDCRETLFSRFICGAIAGGVACFACYPLDLVKTQLTVSKGPSASVGTKSSVYGNLSSTIHNIVQQEGIPGLYRGLLISLGVTIPTFGISFCVYGTVKEKLLSLPDSSYNIFKDPITGHLSTYGSMFSGALSGIASSLLLFPVDSIRRRMQVEKILCHGPDSSSNSNSKIDRIKSSGGAIAEVVRVLKGDGVRGLYRGIVPELLKVTPMVSITFCIYEFIYDLLGA